MEDVFHATILIIGMKLQDCVLHVKRRTSSTSSRKNALVLMSSHMTLDINVSVALNLNIGMRIQNCVNNVLQIHIIQSLR
jgi:hypothetical protein